MSTPSRQSKIVTLNLPPTLLGRFAPKPPAIPIKQTSSNDNASESNATPVPPPDMPTAVEETKKKGTNGPKLGLKRALGEGTDSMPKPRGKPGPKKKPRREDGTIDHGVKTAFGGIVPISTHKLGPKANQGAINAGLRALDRSGKPCRKWERKPMTLKSFTGVVWELPSWRTPNIQLQNGDENSDEKDVSQQSSNSKGNDSSTAVESNGGEQPDLMMMSTPTASSPAPAMATIAANG